MSAGPNRVSKRKFLDRVESLSDDGEPFGLYRSVPAATPGEPERLEETDGAELGGARFEGEVFLFYPHDPLTGGTPAETEGALLVHRFSLQRGGAAIADPERMFAKAYQVADASLSRQERTIVRLEEDNERWRKRTRELEAKVKKLEDEDDDEAVFLEFAGTAQEWAQADIGLKVKEEFAALIGKVLNHKALSNRSKREIAAALRDVAGMEIRVMEEQKTPPTLPASGMTS